MNIKRNEGRRTPGVEEKGKRYGLYIIETVCVLIVVIVGLINSEVLTVETAIVNSEYCTLRNF